MAAQSESAPSFHYSRIAAALARRTLFFGAAVGVFTALYTLTLDNVYQAQAGLLLAPPPVSEALSAKGAVLPENPAAQIGFLMSRPLSVPGYDLLLRNDSIVQALRAKLQELLAKEGGGDDVPLESVRKSMSVQTRVLKQTSSDIEYAPLISLVYTAPSPALAAEMANEWARLSVETSKEISAKGRAGSQAFLSARFDAVVEELRQTETSIQEHEAAWDLENMGKRLAELQTHATSFETELLTLATDIEGTRAELSSVETELTGVGETVTLRKAIPDEAYWLLPDKERSGADRVLETEEINALFVRLQTQKNELQSKLAGMIERKNAIAATLEQLNAQNAQLQEDLAEQKRVRAELTRQANVYTEQYVRLAENLEAARLADARTEADLKIAYAAIPPEHKVGPHRSLTVLTAAILGALVVPLHFLSRLSLRRLAAHLDSTVAGQQPSSAA
ncbi:MAG: hypothetical protein IT365_15135 [Candidatus Hydrogenedentes bacterium]|nr:hypothetical protein [Candidatus Hydrogenedentota bacterium]